MQRIVLSRITPSIGLAKKSIKQAKSFLKDAEDLIKMKKDRMAVIALYNAFFHAARALLFKDGVKERITKMWKECFKLLHSFRRV